MNNVLAYKGFTGTVEYSAKDRIFWGEIAFINDTVLFEGENVKELEKIIYRIILYSYYCFLIALQIFWASLSQFSKISSIPFCVILST